MRAAPGFFLLGAIMLMVLPLAGIAVTGRDPSLYLELPPLTRYVEHAPFSWPVLTGLLLLVCIVYLPFFLRIAFFHPVGGRAPARFPWWGWLGIGLSALFWVLAWSRFSWFAPLQPFTFFPLWAGYIVAINGLTRRRSGRCLLTSRPRFFLLLALASSLFWWFFEYLNRFVQNWYYLGVEDFSAAGYVLHASLCFSTVLPAVISTEEYLASFPRLTVPLADFIRIKAPRSPALAWLVLILAAAGLFGLGIRPDFLFPLLWVAPFLLITSCQVIAGEKTVLAAAAGGDWRPLVVPGLAALVCGFFWELWNFKSLAHWEYSVPYVQRFHLFEMPALGYAGYLPFGLECSLAAGLTHRLLTKST